MVRVVYEPYEELVIKELVHMKNPEDLARLAMAASAGMMAPSTLWAEGILFIAAFMSPENDKMVEELLRGKLYISSVHFVEFPKYQPMVETREKMQVPVIDSSSSPTFSELARWLKKTVEGEPPRGTSPG